MVNGVFQGFAGLKRRDICRRNGDFFAGLWITAFSSALALTSNEPKPINVTGFRMPEWFQWFLASHPAHG